MLSCPLCLEPHFKDVDSLRTTLISVATSELNCPVCNEIFMGLDKLTIHLFTHTEKPEETITKASQSEPVENCDGSENLLVCEFCNFTFSDRFIYEMHQKLLHQSVACEESGALNYHCHLCSKKFKMKGSLMVHLRVAHYGFPNMKLNRKDESMNAHTSPKVADIKHWECEICSKVFTTKYFLKKHKRLHTGEMPYCCTQCNKSFTFQQSYYKHMLYHSSDKPHTCSECGRSFKELSTLQNHARIHSGEKPFVCETCGKRFRQRVSYLVHRRIHTGVMPYKCENCGKSFRYKVSLRSHKCPNSREGENLSMEKSNDVQCILSLGQDGTISFIRKDEINSTSMEQDNILSTSGENIFTPSNSTPDLYSMILSPLLPDVESLRLSSNTSEIEENVKSANQDNQGYFLI